MRSWNYFPTRVAMATARGRRAVTGVCRRHQVTELPPIEAHITEFQCPEVVCPACGKTTQAPVPDEVKRQCGAQLTALIAYLTVVCRLPRRVVQRLLEGALHIPISLGSTHAAWEEASDAVAERGGRAGRGPAAHGDEHLPDATAQCARLSDRRDSMSSAATGGPFTATKAAVT